MIEYSSFSGNVTINGKARHVIFEDGKLEVGDDLDASEVISILETLANGTAPKKTRKPRKTKAKKETVVDEVTDEPEEEAEVVDLAKEKAKKAKAKKEKEKAAKPVVEEDDDDDWGDDDDEDDGDGEDYTGITKWRELATKLVENGYNTGSKLLAKIQELKAEGDVPALKKVPESDLKTRVDRAVEVFSLSA